MTIFDFTIFPNSLYYVTNCKSELANDGKEKIAEEIRTTLNDIRYVDEIDNYNEEEPSTDDNTEQIPSQELKISNILDLDLNRQLDIDELDNFIHEFLLITAPLRILDIIL
ncbi:uncharacterized protein OCT59_027218 [Rhizophagus irregularis]|uniref:uncharacterized protein n=1 Tax=Rhizophagus irregularis TaxID=588596 RepID=UPI001D4442A1|nr:hypothetical protein OCT59_027218 [Rhizophagus irregularis]CAG8654345.1 19845_t:CDS:2 [Rhizophagus irregularis]